MPYRGGVITYLVPHKEDARCSRILGPCRLLHTDSRLCPVCFMRTMTKG